MPDLGISSDLSSVVDEGPVRIEMTGDPDHPTRVVQSHRPRVLFLPILYAEDGYGLTFGARLAVPNVAGANSRLSFPLTLGGTHSAGIDGQEHRARLHQPVARRRRRFATRESGWSVRPLADAHPGRAQFQTDGSGWGEAHGNVSFPAAWTPIPAPLRQDSTTPS